LYSIDEFVRGAKHARILDKAWAQIFGVKVRGALPESFEDREIVLAAGEGHALLHFPTPVVSEDGTSIERHDWARRPTLEQLRDYPYSDGRVDVIGEAVSFEDVVSFVVGKDWNTGEVHVVGPRGESTIGRRGEAPTRAAYRQSRRSATEAAGVSACD